MLTLLAVAAFIFLSFELADPRLWAALLCLVLFGGVLYYRSLFDLLAGAGRRSRTVHVQACADAGDRPAWTQCWAAHLRLAVMVALATLLTVLGAESFATIVLFFVVSAQAPEWLPRRQDLVWPLIGGLITIALMINLVGSPMTALFVGLGATGGYLFMGSATESRMRADAANRESQRLLAELTEAHRQLQTYATQVETLAVAEERNRLSREMHDTLGHRLTVAAVQLEGAQRLISQNPERARTMVATVREEIVDGLRELRQTVARLRTPLEADLRLPHALTKLGDGFAAATGITVHLDIAPDLPDLAPDQRQALFRAAQEALTNTQRHSGASTVWLSAQTESAPPAHVCLRVDDDGCGIDDESLLRGYGLRGMRERADQLHGYMHLQRRSAHGGAGVEICLPLNGSAASVATPDPAQPVQQG
ncbi:MAG: sensor histidine kinase [Caldilineaceae bacterium]|nr:sensor histidine kinase [Caldilineaceae bacterium]